MSKTSSKQVANILFIHMVASFGIFTYLLTDNAPQFVKKLLDAYFRISRRQTPDDESIPPANQQKSRTISSNHLHPPQTICRRAPTRWEPVCATTSVRAQYTIPAIDKHFTVQPSTKLSPARTFLHARIIPHNRNSDTIKLAANASSN